MSGEVGGDEWRVVSGGDCRGVRGEKWRGVGRGK